MKYYHFKCETYSNETIKIVVCAKTKEEAIEKLSSYKISRGELHYYCLVDVTDNGEECFYENKNNALPLLIALAGTKLGCEQISQYGRKANFLNCLNEETISLIK